MCVLQVMAVVLQKKIVERLWDANNDVVNIISSHRWASVAAFSAS